MAENFLYYYKPLQTWSPHKGIKRNFNVDMCIMNKLLSNSHKTMNN